MSVDYDNTNPITVKIVEDTTKEKRPEELRVAHRTIVLTATNPYLQVAGFDPALKMIRMNILDNPIVLCKSISQASDQNNTTGTMTAPNGRIMPIGIDYVIPGPDEMWISTNTYPTRVGITYVRCI